MLKALLSHATLGDPLCRPEQKTISAAAYGTGLTRQKLEFRRDALGRMAGKKVYHYSSGWVLDSETRYVFDGANMIEKLSVSGSTITKLRTHAWGLDWSGSLHGAGGVGGLLMTKDGSDTYLPMFDGNGNLMGRLKSSDGSLAAAYEYDAFGQVLRESGPYAATDVFRFSTKFTHAETGEVDYGMRIYLPSLGRFLNQDPIGERGGLNLYAFVRNDGVNNLDYLGMDLMLLDGAGRFKTEEVYPLPKMVVTAYRQSAQEKGWIIDMLLRGAVGRGPSGEGGSGRGGGAGSTPATTTDPTPGDLNTTPGSETVVLDSFIVTGKRPAEPPMFIIPNITRTLTFNFAPSKTPDKKDDKWDIQKCSDLWDQIQSNNARFQRYSNDLNDQLDFQRDANFDLFLVDRARDTAFSLAGGQLTKGIAATRAALQGAPSLSNVLLASSGTVTLGYQTVLGKAVSYAAGPGIDKGITLASSYLGKQPFIQGTNGVRNQIQDTVNSLDSQTQGLAGTLKAQRDDYRKHCQ